jgi:Tfp pilus assembly protein FimT
MIATQTVLALGENKFHATKYSHVFQDREHCLTSKGRRLVERISFARTVAACRIGMPIAEPRDATRQQKKKKGKGKSENIFFNLQTEPTCRSN